MSKVLGSLKGKWKRSIASVINGQFSSMKEMKEIVSNCCGASLWHTETEICSECMEHCESE